MDTRLRPHLRDIMLAGHKHSHIKRSKASKGSRTLSDIADERCTRTYHIYLRLITVLKKKTS